MPLVTVLAVGLESSLFTADNPSWESAGYLVTSTWSIREAITLFRDGDFDVVILGHSLQIENRERLTFLIRALGSSIPVVCTTDSSAGHDSFADATIPSEAVKLLDEVGVLLARRARTIAMNKMATAIRDRKTG